VIIKKQSRRQSSSAPRSAVPVPSESRGRIWSPNYHITAADTTTGRRGRFDVVDSCANTTHTHSLTQLRPWTGRLTGSVARAGLVGHWLSWSAHGPLDVHGPPQSYCLLGPAGPWTSSVVRTACNMHAQWTTRTVVASMIQNEVCRPDTKWDRHTVGHFNFGLRLLVSESQT